METYLERVEREDKAKKVLSDETKLKKFNAFWEGGESNKKGITDKDVDAKQLAMGVKVEMEHTSDPETARKVARDHLAEFPRYYTALEEMEKKLKAEQKKK